MAVRDETESGAAGLGDDHAVSSARMRGVSQTKDIELEASYLHGELIAAYLHLPAADGAPSTRCEEAGPGLVIDFASDGRPIGIEVTMPRLVTVIAINEVLSKLGMPTMSERDLAPLKVA